MPSITARLQSSWLRTSAYDPDTKQLELRTARGQTYTYEQVPLDIFERLREATSAGEFFNQNIKDRY